MCISEVYIIYIEFSHELIMEVFQYESLSLCVCIYVWSLKCFSDYGIHSILYQRGIFPPESFRAEDHFGLSILVSTDTKIQAYLETVFDQMKGNNFKNILELLCIRNVRSNGYDKNTAFKDADGLR